MAYNSEIKFVKLSAIIVSETHLTLNISVRNSWLDKGDSQAFPVVEFVLEEAIQEKTGGDDEYNSFNYETHRDFYFPLISLILFER